ncbi:putative glutathione transferase [Helianthus annuus]|nr:putative glutathione transferase [Helianthus annuus]KAJ0487272.1 putative glutathione transferase [Helianthus annuus]KAJ0661382.1 putative glutathione transferase [Helianthus annuus]
MLFVLALEHNNEVKGESLDLIKYIDTNFEGPSFYPDVDIAYAPFIERFQPYLLDVKKYDIKVGRPKLAAWIEVLLSLSQFVVYARFVVLSSLVLLVQVFCRKKRNHIYVSQPAFLYKTLIAIDFSCRK